MVLSFSQFTMRERHASSVANWTAAASSYVFSQNHTLLDLGFSESEIFMVLVRSFLAVLLHSRSACESGNTAKTRGASPSRGQVSHRVARAMLAARTMRRLWRTFSDGKLGTSEFADFSSENTHQTLRTTARTWENFPMPPFVVRLSARLIR
jgi:hypothetical protein